MINTVNSIRYFLFVSLCLQSFLGMAGDKGPLFPQPLFSQPLPHSTSSGKSGMPAVNIKKFLLPLNVKAFSDYLSNLNIRDQINLAALQSTMVNTVKSHPKTFCVVVGGAGILACLYALKKSISEENWLKLKTYCITNTKALATRFYNSLPPEAQGFILFFKRPCDAFCNWVITYNTHHKKYVGAATLCTVMGEFTGWTRTWRSLAAIAFVYGAFASRFDRLEEKIDAIDARIQNLGQNVGRQVQDVSAQIVDVQKTAGAIRKDILDLKGQLQNVATNNQESAAKLQERLDALEISLNKASEERINTCKQEMLARINDVSLKLDSINTQVTTMDTKSTQKIDSITVSLGNILDQTSDAAKTIKKLEEQSNNIETKNDEQYNNVNEKVTGLGTQLTGLGIQLENVENSIHEKLLSLVEQLNILKTNQDAMQLQQTQQGAVIKSIQLKQDLQQENIDKIAVLMTRLEKMEEQRKKDKEEAENKLNEISSQQQQMANQINGIALRGDQRMNTIENKIDNNQKQIVNSLDNIQQNQFIQQQNQFEQIAYNQNQMLEYNPAHQKLLFLTQQNNS